MDVFVVVYAFCITLPLWLQRTAFRPALQSDVAHASRIIDFYFFLLKAGHCLVG